MHWFFCLLISFTGLAQSESNSAKKKANLYLSAGSGISYFHYNVRTFNHNIHGRSYRFEAPNFRIALIADKPISEKISMKVGLRIGFRMKRASLYEDPKLGNIVYPYSFFYLDEKVSHSSSTFVEIPIGVQYNKEKFKIGIGVLYRSLTIFADGDSPDIGIVPSLLYTLNDKVNIGLEYYLGTTAFTGDSVHDDFGKYIYYKSTNRFVQISIEYKLKRKY